MKIHASPGCVCLISQTSVGRALQDLCVCKHLPDKAALRQLMTEHFKGLSEAKAEVAQVWAEMGRPVAQMSTERGPCRCLQQFSNTTAVT